jgi:hypothetical protein
MATQEMIVAQLGTIKERLQELWRTSAYQETVCFTHPHPKPDFESIENFIQSWVGIAPEKKEFADKVAQDLRGLRDLVSLSDLAVDFCPLEGHGYKYDAPSGKITAYRYRHARTLIDQVGREVAMLIRDLEG